MEKVTINKIKKENKEFFKMIEKNIILNWDHPYLCIDSLNLITTKKIKLIGGIKINFIENKLEVILKNIQYYNDIKIILILSNNYKTYNLRILKDDLLNNDQKKSITRDALLDTIKIIEIENLKENLDNNLSKKDAPAKKIVKV